MAEDKFVKWFWNIVEGIKWKKIPETENELNEVEEI